MAINPLGMNEGTQEFIRFEDDGGTINTQVVDLRQGTVTLTNTTGTTVTVDHGTITLSNPTGTTVQFNNGTVDLLKAGTITRVEGGSIVMTAGTVAAHAITAATITAGTLTNLVSGTINAATAVLNNGTIDLLKAGTITKLEQGSINVTAGTVTAGSIRVTAGTVGGAAATAVALSGNPVPVGGVDTGGTVYGLLVDAKGQQILGGGTVDMLKAGTISTLPNLPGGSIAVTAGTVSAGTINTGTINAGTINVGTVIGNVASGATDSGNPVKVGGINNTTQPTLTDGQRGDMQLDTRGNVKTVIYGNNSTTSITNVASNADAIAVTSTGAFLGVRSNTMVFNGSSWDRMRGDTTGIFLSPLPGTTILTAGTTSAGTIGTIVAAPGAGTAIYITGFHVLQVSGTAETVVSFGLQAAGNQVVARGNYAAGGGITESKTFPSGYGATGTALTWNMLSGSGTVSYKVEYFTR